MEMDDEPGETHSINYPMCKTGKANHYLRRLKTSSYHCRP